MVRRRQIVVTGASGFVAKNLRRHLSENNYKLVSISRNNFGRLRNEERIVSKGYDEGLILPKIKDSYAIFHLVGAGRQSIKNDYDAVNVQLTRHMLDMGRKAKITRFVFASGLGVSPRATSDYFISKYRAERLIVNSGLDYTIFRPSYIVGRDDLLTKHLKRQIRGKIITIPGSGKYPMQPIYINDVTRVFEESIMQDRFRNKTIDLVGPQPITFEKYARLLSKGTGTTIRKVNLEHAYREALVNPRADFGIDDLNIQIGGFRGDHSRLGRLSKVKFESVPELLKSGVLS